jgi:hypothetical protein
MMGRLSAGPQEILRGSRVVKLDINNNGQVISKYEKWRSRANGEFSETCGISQER